MVVKVEEDDHGHATLVVHGEPELINALAQAVVMILAVDAEQIVLPDGDDLMPGGGDSPDVESA